MLWVGVRRWDGDIGNATQIWAQKETMGLEGTSSVSASELLTMALWVVLATDKEGIYFLLLKLQYG